ncbi:putative MATE family efflux protein [Bacillus oleivorans]|uniref:Probable multidrug resistance protein NorM n=1 Tax=Bacillus oleivorans TaxID=1448271 RepID=A0A285D585_9BACI|nr:MATE family efflux transporter [Bacillus oleivorans]SNX74448.1 putative MATE family efflux protein [Bacillus oleivorans]
MSATESIHDKTAKQKVMVILSLAVPAMIENILQTVVGFVDTLFVARLGLNEVTAVGIANTIIAVYMAIFLAIGVGASSLIARSIGAGDLAKAKGYAKQSTWISIVIGIIFGIISYFFAEPLLTLMGAEPEVLKDGVIYFRIVAVPSIFISLMLIFGSILRAAGDTKTPMKVSLWINFIHIGLDYVLIFGMFGFNGLGVAGAAWATVIVRIIGTIALYRSIQKSKVNFSVFKITIISKNPLTASIIKLAIPTAAERLIMRLGQVLYFGLIVRIGTETYAAHTIAGNIEMFSYMPGYGLAVAATTLVGQSIGARHHLDAYKYGILTSGIGILIMSVGGVLLFLLSPWMATWFTTEPTAIDMVVTALRIDAFAQPALAVGLILAGALQGIGDTKSPMYSTAIGMWVIRIVGVYILGIQLGMGIAGVWLSIAIDLFVRAIFLLFRFKAYFKERSFDPPIEKDA